MLKREDVDSWVAALKARPLATLSIVLISLLGLIAWRYTGSLIDQLAISGNSKIEAEAGHGFDDQRATPQDDRPRYIEDNAEGLVTPPDSFTEEPMSGMVEEVDGIAFHLRGCNLSHSVLRCDLTVTSRDRDLLVEICAPCFRRASSRLITPDGTQYLAEAAFLGTDYSGEASGSLPADVPMKAGIRFNGLSAQNTKLQLLEIYFMTGMFRRGMSAVRFRDVSVSSAESGAT